MQRLARHARVPRGRHFPWGGAILEMVLVLPLLVGLTFGAIEYSDYMYVRNALFGAARNGVRAAIPSTATNANVTSAVSASLSVANIPSTAYTLTTSPTNIATATAGSYVTVTITTTWGNVGVTPLPTYLGGIPTTKSMSGVCVMIKEQ